MFVSHYHYDHVSDAGALMFARLVQRKVGEELGDITFYALGGSEQFEPDFSRLSMEGASRAVAIDEGSRVDLGGLSLEFMRTSHPVPCLAACVRAADGATLVYTADGALTEGLIDFCRGADALICECSLYEGYDGSVMGHMSCEDVTALAERGPSGHARAEPPAHLRRRRAAAALGGRAPGGGGDRRGAARKRRAERRRPAVA